MRGMKDTGLKDVRSLRRRALRMQAMGRLLKPDVDYIKERLDEVEARIVTMQEFDESGKEVRD